MKGIKKLFYDIATDRYTVWLIILAMSINFIHKYNFGYDWLFFGVTCVLCGLVGIMNGDRKASEERVKELENAIEEHNKKVEEEVE